MSQIQQAGTPVLCTSTAAVSLQSGSLLGYHVNSTSGSATMVIRRGGSAAGVAISGTITPTIGYKDFPAYCVGGCHVTLAGVINVTLFFSAG